MHEPCTMPEVTKLELSFCCRLWEEAAFWVKIGVNTRSQRYAEGEESPAHLTVGGLLNVCKQEMKLNAWKETTKQKKL